MIKTLYPFEIKKNLHSINEYLFIIKNMFRLISKNGLYRKINGKYFYVFWDNNLNEWSINLKQNKEIDIKKVFTKEFTLFLERFHLKKHCNRALVFINDNSYFYPIFLANIKEDKFLEKIVISDTFIEEVCKTNIFFRNSKINLNLIDYSGEYKKFKSNLFSEKLTDSLGNVFHINEIFKKSVNNKSRLSYSEFTKILNNKIIPKNNQTFYYSIYFITIYLGNYLNMLLLNRKEDYLNFIVKDNLQNKIIKIPFEFYKKDLTIKKELLPPLLPRSY